MPLVLPVPLDDDDDSDSASASRRCISSRFSRFCVSSSVSFSVDAKFVASDVASPPPRSGVTGVLDFCTSSSIDSSLDCAAESRRLGDERAGAPIGMWVDDDAVAVTSAALETDEAVVAALCAAGVVVRVVDGVVVCEVVGDAAVCGDVVVIIVCAE